MRVPLPPEDTRQPLLVFLSDALEYPPRLGYHIHLLSLAAACSQVMPTRVLTWVPPPAPAAPRAARPGSPASGLPSHVEALEKPNHRPITKGTKLAYVRWAVDWLERNAPPGSWVWVRGYSTAFLLASAIPRLRRAPWGLRFVYDAASILRLERRRDPRGWADAARGGIEARLWGRFDRLRTLCDPMKEYLVGAGVPERRIGVIPVGCERQETAWRPTAGGKRLLYVGSAASWQGIPHLLAAMRLLEHSEPACELSVVGVEAGAPGLPAAGANVRFRGQLAHRAALATYLEHDLCVVPRTPSPVTRTVLPMKVPEAMAFGIPLLVTDLPAIRWATGDDGAFFLSGNSPEEIESGVRRALADPQRLLATSRAALGRAAELYWDRIAERIRLWLEAAGATPGAGRPSGGPPSHG